MKWSVVAFDRVHERWITETVIAEKAYIASSGALSFLNSEKIESVPAIENATEPLTAPLVPVRVVTGKTRRPGRNVMKIKKQQVQVRSFAHGAWHDLQLEKQL